MNILGKERWNQHDWDWPTYIYGIPSLGRSVMREKKLCWYNGRRRQRFLVQWDSWVRCALPFKTLRRSDISSPFFDTWPRSFYRHISLVMSTCYEYLSTYYEYLLWVLTISKDMESKRENWINAILSTWHFERVVSPLSDRWPKSGWPIQW